MVSFDPNNPKPIYEQIYEQFVKLISSQVLKPEDQLPSVRELASTIRLNPNTIQRAYKQLENDHYIYSLPGKGNFVARADHVISAEIQRKTDELVSCVKVLKGLGVEDDAILAITRDTVKGVENNASS
jgi:GntR family transcriptional regulator